MKYPPLSPDQQALAEEGMRYLPIVLARTPCLFGEREEIDSDANLLVVRAVQRWNPARGRSFKNWVVYYLSMNLRYYHNKFRRQGYIKVARTTKKLDNLRDIRGPELLPPLREIVTPRGRLVLREMKEYQDAVVVAERLGVSRSQVYKMIQDAELKLSNWARKELT